MEEIIEAGKLYIVPTPIGNLKDITLRAIEVLQTVDLVAAEDTRQSLKLLNHLNIKKSLISYHQHNEEIKSGEIISKLKEGKSIAVVSDAGTPGISDPGCVIVSKCIEEGIAFEVLPGATAITTALVYSGLSTRGFVFKGFLPREDKDRRKIIDELKEMSETLVFYEAPHRLLNTLKFLLDTLGNRKIALCRELTKLHEDIKRVTLEEAVNFYSENVPRGEFVLVVSGKSEEEKAAERMEKLGSVTIEQHIRQLIDSGIDKKEAVKIVAKERKLPKSEVYKHSIDL